MDDGIWRTIAGRRVFIKNGQSLTEAMKNSGKFKMQKNDIQSRLKKQFKKDESKEYKTLEEKITCLKQNEDAIIKELSKDISSEEADKKICEILQEKQGFNKKPKVISAKEFDKLEDSKYIKLYRGISDSEEKTAQQYIEQFKYGKNEYGNGLNAYGVGHYTSTDENVAKTYGTTMKIAISKDAKIGIINMDEYYEKDILVLSANAYKPYLNDINGYYNKYGKNITRILDEAEREPSMFAIMEKYDAIRVIDHYNSDIKGETYILLNRGKVIVKDE